MADDMMAPGPRQRTEGQTKDEIRLPTTAWSYPGEDTVNGLVLAVMLVGRCATPPALIETVGATRLAGAIFHLRKRYVPSAWIAAAPEPRGRPGGRAFHQYWLTRQARRAMGADGRIWGALVIERWGIDLKLFPAAPDDDAPVS